MINRGGQGIGGRDTPVAPGRDAGVPPARGVGLELLIRRHNLPHWQVGGSCYFITFRCVRGRLPSKCLEVVERTLLHDHGRRYDLHLATVMPDHVHAIVTPRELYPGRWIDLAQITRMLKGVSARRINHLLGTAGRVWRSEAYDRIIRDEAEYAEKMHYVANNAVIRGLCEEPFDYAFLVVPPGEAPGLGKAEPTAGQQCPIHHARREE